MNINEFEFAEFRSIGSQVAIVRAHVVQVDTSEARPVFDRVHVPPGRGHVLAATVTAAAARFKLS